MTRLGKMGAFREASTPPSTCYSEVIFIDKRKGATLLSEDGPQPHESIESSSEDPADAAHDNAISELDVTNL